MSISKTAAQWLLVVTVACAIFSTPIITLAHCDGLDGPVVKAARKAVEAYVSFIHYAERLYDDAKGPAQGHFKEAEKEGSAHITTEGC